jgi:hypothetical protein
MLRNRQTRTGNYLLVVCLILELCYFLGVRPLCVPFLLVVHEDFIVVVLLLKEIMVGVLG